MNDIQKLRLFWKIIDIVNKKFCKNKLKINSIAFFKKCNKDKKTCKAVTTGYYTVYSKRIGINSNTSLICQIDTLCHELAHVYQHQILGHSGRHDKRGGKIYQKFLKETDKILKVEFK